MDWNKYLSISTKDYKTAKEIGVAAPTLCSWERKGLVKSTNTIPKTYCRVNSIAAKIYYLCDKYADKYDQYFVIEKKDTLWGMMCSIIDNTICDCWGKPYDLTDSIYINFRGNKIDIRSGKPICIKSSLLENFVKH